jgi:catechol 2,3-dioxygenase-like lactoylglutathione lyase family enzyme
MSGLIRQMGYVVVATPELEACAADLTDIVGLQVRWRNETSLLMSSNARQCEVAYVQAASPGIRAVGLEAVDGAAVAEILRRAKSENLTILDDKPLVPGIERAVRFRTPFGPIFEVHTPSPRDDAPAHHRPPTRARRLDHVNLRVNDPRGFHDLMTGLLTMRLSDRTEDFGRAWYRAADGFHHSVAAGLGSGLHHFGFDAPSVLDLVAVADTLVSKERTLLWGIGHHGPGNNIFSYYVDPIGCVIETSFGMERIDNDEIREPGVWDADYDKRVLDLWGSKPPPDYAGRLTPFSE